MSDSDPRLALIASAWGKADAFSREADDAQDEADRLTGLANEAEDVANDLIDQVVGDHPEWERSLKWDRKVPDVQP